MKTDYLNDENEILCKSSVGRKWLILLLSCIGLLGDFYCFNTAGAVSMKMLNRFPDHPNILKILYSVYSIPNTILPMLGGLLIYKYGFRIMFLIFGFLVLIGHFFVVLGCSISSVPLMILGKIIFSLGGENLNTAQFALIIEWFKKKELGFALGICLSCGRIGNLLNEILSPIIAENSDLSTALWIGFTLTTFSYLAIVTLVYLDWRQEILIQMREIVNSNTIMLNQQSRPMDSVYTLPGIFYLLAFLCTVVYGGVLPFNYLASNFKIKTLYFNSPSKFSKLNENFNLILQLMTSVLFIPIIGYCVDIVGKRTKLLVTASSIGVITYILFILTYPTIPMILLGFTYSLFATIIWPCLALVVKKEIIGVAFGLTSSLQNIGIVIFPLIVEFIFVKTKNYEITILFFLFLMIFGLILSILILLEDKSFDNILNSDLIHLQNECSCNCSFKANDKKMKFQKSEEETRLLA